MPEKNELLITRLVVAANLNLVVFHLIVSCFVSFLRYWYAWFELSLEAILPRGCGGSETTL